MKPTALQPRKTLYATLAAAGLLLPGCYDAEAMIQRVRNDAIQTRLEEVDLGEFHVTLPRDTTNNEMTEVFLHVFGASVRYRIPTIEEKLSKEDHLLKQAILVALRKTTNEEFAEPEMSKLRVRLQDAVNGVLSETPIERIGFYSLRLVRH